MLSFGAATFVLQYTIKTREDYFTVVSHGCETWSLTLWDEFWLRVFENRVLKKIFEPKKDEITGEW